MTITIAFRPKGAPPLSVVVDNDARFVRLGDQCPDVFIRPTIGGLTIIASHGCVEVDDVLSIGKPLAKPPIQGVLYVESNGAPLVKKVALDLRYGGAIPFRTGSAAKPPYVAPTSWSAWWLRHWPKGAATSSALRKRYVDVAYNFDDSPYFNASQSGSPRAVQAGWPGTLVAALRLGEDADVWEAARAFTDFQMKWRHAIFYDANGKLLRADEQSWWKVGRYGLEGQVKWTSDSPYEREDEQHVAIERLLEAAVGYGDEAARLYCEADMECWMTRPEFRGAQLADDQRTHGYLIRRIVEQMLAFPDQADSLGPALQRVVDGLRRAFGYEGGDSDSAPFVSRAPPKTGKWSHGYPSRKDWDDYAAEHNLVLPAGLLPPVQGETCDHLRDWLKSMAIVRHLAPDHYTDADTGLWGWFRAVVVWQLSVILHALCALRDVPAAASFVPDIHQLIRRTVACIVGPGRAAGEDVHGQPVRTASIWDAYAALRSRRVVAPESEKNGTPTWMPDALLQAYESIGPGHRQQAYDLARWIWERTDYPHELDLQIFGPIVWREFGNR